MNKIFFLVLGLLCSICVFDAGAQQSFTGSVFDKTSSNPLEGVTIKIKSQSDSIELSASTNKSGAFVFQTLKPGRYFVTTNFVGYKSESALLEIVDKAVRHSFRLEQSEIMIEEVAIVAQPLVVIRGDTTEFDATKFATREYADADELIAQIPGVQIDEEGNITAQGESVPRIIVDGKEFFSTDPRVVLKMLPAEIISKIQLIDEKSEQARFSGFDDGKRTKIINIVTKEDRRVGYFGRIMTGKGDADKYSANINVSGFDNSKRFGLILMANNINETNAGEMGRGRFGGRGGGGNNNAERGIADTYIGSATFNNSYLKNKMEVSSDYKFTWNGTETNTVSNIEYLTAVRANQFQDQTQFSDNVNNEHVANARIRWDIDSANRLDFAPNIAFTSTNRYNTNFSSTSREMIELINQTDRSGNNENTSFRYGGNLTLMHRFKKPGRTISLNASGNANTNDALGINLAMTEYYKDALLDRIDTNNNRSTTHGYGSGFNTRVSLTENLTRLSRLQFNYNFRNTASYSNRETFEFLAETGQLGELRDRLSNEFRNDFNFHSSGLSYSYNKRDSLRIQVGLNYQYGIRQNNRTVPINLVTEAIFGSWLPEFTAVYNFTREKTLEFNYTTSTNAPNINQLQDFINNQNELRITNGNPDLKQEYTNNFRLQYRSVDRNTGKSLNTSVNFDYINDRIVESVLMADSTIQLYDDVILGAGGQYRVPINMDGSYNLRVDNSYGLPIAKLMNLNFNTRLYYNNNLGMINSVATPSKSYGFTQGINVNSNFSRKHIIALGYTLIGNYTENPTNTIPKYSIYNHRFSNTVTLEFLKNFVLNSTLSYLYNGGINGGEGISTTIWNASLGFKVLKKKDGEISIRGFDLLNNAQNVNRSVNQMQASNVTSNTLNRYFLVSLTYNLRNFAGGGSGGNQGGRRNFEGGGWQGGGGQRGRN